MVPAGNELPWNQSIFIRYYKMKRRLLRLPKVIKAAAGPHVLPGGEPDGDSPALLAEVYGDGDDEMEVDIEQVSGRTKIVDPVNNLLDYILEHSHADLAIASDGDVRALFQGIPRDMKAALSLLSPVELAVVVDEHGVSSA
ncbi:hypothetical protein K466DRAFT_605198 [Polyporus arcularius HHB13444]|uniref:Uncharacterized protein n=1 Tax=Polyporus arcularius HHB13444 TaxID=1314778 RepID=A0A5C3NW92_9APHY|nr:hypothetical protein K466DRAFT_605198 [Polyporus arcularius HHB13444]